MARGILTSEIDGGMPIMRRECRENSPFAPISARAFAQNAPYFAMAEIRPVSMWARPVCVTGGKSDIIPGGGARFFGGFVVKSRQFQQSKESTMTTTGKRILIGIVAAAALAMAGCGEKPGPKLREIERVQEMSDDEIKAAREQCHIVATADYNCSELVHPGHGMSTEEWKELTESTRECRKNQLLSFHHCLRGKGVRYSEYD